MSDVSVTLQRWHSLSRSDRKAILARLDDDQRRGLMAMIDAKSRAARAHSPTDTGLKNWAMFSSPLSQLLHALEARTDAPPAELRITPAAAQLLLVSAQQMRDGGAREESWQGKVSRRWRQWLKDMDL